MTLPDLERRVKLAASFLREGYSRQAVETLRWVLSLDRDHPTAHALLAQALLDLRRVAAADHEASRALICDPDCFEANHAAARVRLEQRRFEEAQSFLTWCLDHRPGHAVSLTLLGRLRVQQDRHDEARAVFEDALAHDPERPEPMVELGTLALGDGDRETAERWAGAALRRAPEDPDAIVLMGRVLFRRGEVADARRHAIWALRSDASHSGALALLAAVKARDSEWVGYWWRFNAWLGEFGDSRSIVLLLGAFLVCRVLSRVLADLGEPGLVTVLELSWLGLLTYSWIGPRVFRRALMQELGQSRLRDDG